MHFIVNRLSTFKNVGGKNIVALYKIVKCRATHCENEFLSGGPMKNIWFSHYVKHNCHIIHLSVVLSPYINLYKHDMAQPVYFTNCKMFLLIFINVYIHNTRYVVMCAPVYRYRYGERNGVVKFEWVPFLHVKSDRSKWKDIGEWLELYLYIYISDECLSSILFSSTYAICYVRVVCVQAILFTRKCHIWGDNLLGLLRALKCTKRARGMHIHPMCSGQI